MRGATYIQAPKTRLAVLTKHYRSATGRDLHGRCDLGCQTQGNLHYITQVCPRAQPQRIQCHNGILDLMSGWLRDKNYEIRREQRIATPEGLRLPDLICHKDMAYVIDVQVSSDSNFGTLAEAHQRKIDKYDRPSILDFKNWSGFTGTPVVSSITVNWRGIVAPATLSLLTDLGIPASSTDVLVPRTLRGSVSMYANYMGTSGRGMSPKLTVAEDVPSGFVNCERPC